PSVELLKDHLNANSLSPSQIICLGLGSPSSSPNSRAQLAFLLEVCKSTGIEHSDVSIYDPIFCEEDVTLFDQLGLCTLSEDRAKGRSFIRSDHNLMGESISIQMPHCDLDLYEGVLAANWSEEKLPNAILIANRLGDYVDSNPSQKMETRAPCLLRLASAEGYLECCPLPVCSIRATAFNTIAIQSLSSKAKLTDSWFSSISSAATDI
ncbi:SRR1-domain-containing protein, partial [Mycena filopes]